MVLSIPALSPPAALLGQGRHLGLPLRLGASSAAIWRCSSSKKEGASFTDRILDYIEGGPKLRKWYGAPELLPKDGREGDQIGEQEPEEEEEDRDAVLVTNGDTEIGQLVILSLILKRARIKAIVKDKRATTDAFSTYVEPINIEASSRSSAKTLKGVRSVICPSNEGFLSSIGPLKGIKHIVLLSQLAAYRGSSGLQAIMKSKLMKLAEKDEEAVIASGIPYTIIRAGVLQDGPGDVDGFSFKEGVAARGKISREDAAKICVEALDVIPQKGLVFEVATGDAKVSDWKELLTAMIRNKEQPQ